MSISAKLILALVVTISVFNGVSGYLNLRRREDALRTTMQNEVRAHAYTLQIALEEHYAAGREIGAEQLIGRLVANPGLYNVILFDQTGAPAFPLEQSRDRSGSRDASVAQAIAARRMIERLHRVNGSECFSLIMPIRMGAGRQGAFEINQPLTSVEADISSAQFDYLASRMLSVVLMLLIVVAIMTYGLARPIKKLLECVRAIGRGDLSSRILLSSKYGEISELATEFNRMAEQLAQQRDAAAREAAQRLALERELRHRDRLSLLGRMAASIAHEMGTPLNVIDGRVAQLQETADAPVELKQRNLTIIRTQVQRIARFVRQILNLAHPQQLHRGPIDLNALLAAIIELLEAEARRSRVEIEFLAGSPVEVDADQDLLQQVFLNICLNGIQAMKDGGRLKIEIAQEEAMKDGRPYIAVRISDTGQGIAAEYLEQIFDPFFTTKDVGEGTGLGLALTQQIVEEHGGWIEAANGENGGAVFSVFLPEIDRASVSAVASQGKPSELRAS